MMKHTIMISAALALSLGCSAPENSEVDQGHDVGADVGDFDLGGRDLGGDMEADMLPSPEVCEAIVTEHGGSNSFQRACSAAGCFWDGVFPTFEKAGECRYRWEDANEGCFAILPDTASDSFPSSYVNDRTGEVLIINSLYYDRIIGWTQCQSAIDDAPSLPADHICRTCKEISDP